MERRSLRYLGREIPFEPGESVLDCLKAQGVVVASICHEGVCRACVLRAVEGDVCRRAQSSLHTGARAEGHFLSCLCPSKEGLRVQPIDHLESSPGRIQSVERVERGVVRARIGTERALNHRSGQIVQIVRPSDGAFRPFGLANSAEENFLEIFVEERKDALFSPWLLGGVGESVMVRGPSGHFFYMNDPEEPLVLTGGGVAAAPALGVLRAAIRAGHRAPITFIRLGSQSSGYFCARLEDAARRARCELKWKELIVGPSDERVAERIMNHLPESLLGTRAYFAGAQLLLRKLRLL